MSSESMLTGNGIVVEGTTVLELLRSDFYSWNCFHTRKMNLRNLPDLSVAWFFSSVKTEIIIPTSGGCCEG